MKNNSTQSEKFVSRYVDSNKNILLLILSNPNDLHLSFVRCSVFYEHRLFQGQVLSKDQFQNIVKKVPKYAGHNFPFSVYKQWFASQKYEDLTSLENSIATFLKKQSTVQYIIATAEYDLAALNHELYHAVYHICPIYRKKVEKAYNLLPQGSLNAVERFMDGKGYHRNVFIDEFQAYLMCNPMEFKAADSKLMQKIQRDLKIFIDDNKLWRWDLAMANKKQ